jgi:glycosyltransferase involved in cell wall biosynthesis
MKISIITISFNSEKTIEDTIKSVTTQDYNDIEYIIIDGGSRDRTLDIVNSYKDSISVILSEKDKGISDAFNKGIRLATGDLIGIINSDDILLPGSVKFLVNNIDNETDVIYGDIIRWRDEENIEKVVKANDNLKVLHHSFSCMYHPSTFIRKRAYDKHGLYKTNIRYAMDRELLLRMYKEEAIFKRVNYTFVKFRVGGASCENYSKTAFESMNVSVEHGLSIYLAFPKTIFNIFKMYSITYVKQLQFYFKK